MRNLAALLPGIKYGHKVHANEMAGAPANVHVGNMLYVDANSGNNSTNSGTSWNDAFKTLSKAEDTATTNNYDQIIVAPNGTSGTAETATITWDKNHISVVGAAAPVSVSQRSRIVTTTDSVDPCYTLSGAGNQFINLQMATWQASNDVLINVTGERNYFGNTHLAGIGHATAGDDTSARCLLITGAGENEFVGCTIGVDTIARSVANASFEATGSCPRNIFRDCFFPLFADNSGALFCKLDTGNCNERFLLFQRCLFNNPNVNGSATKITVAFDTAGAGNGTIIMNECYGLGFTDWANNFAAMHSAGMAEQPTAATAGIMLVLA